ncbi:MAG TPA: hypothetical protein VFY79_06390 [Dehalococcoidia bacterium]|jgi:hypothetical protein|nr:hypothetical protein [Dehalococcoidia bacterium]
MAGFKSKTGIVALERPLDACPVVTLQFPAPGQNGTLRVTLSLCEWQRVAQQIADAALAVAS